MISIDMHITFDESVGMKFLKKFSFFHSFVDLWFGLFFPGELADGLLDAHYFLRTLPSKPTKYSDIAISVVNMLPDNDHSLLMKMNVKNQVHTLDSYSQNQILRSNHNKVLKNLKYLA